jgi:hypothetical protein
MAAVDNNRSTDGDLETNGSWIQSKPSKTAETYDDVHRWRVTTRKKILGESPTFIPVCP